MCGIVGSVGPSRCDLETLRTMRDRLRHRGPDSSGELVDGPVALGVRRLRIIDLARGEQPIANEDRSVWVIQNGEIYNFQELRRSLEARGHRFATASDTEVLVHAYEDHGADLPHLLEGMFAFAVWDSARRTLLLARDRMGKKPLFYATFPDGTLAFASELHALLLHPGVERAVDSAAIDLYLTLGYVPAPLTAIVGVHKVPPAHALEWRDGSARIYRYWSPPRYGSLAIGREDAQAELLRRLRAAVRERLIADVPLGALLSGGMDSSTVVALMAEASTRVRTFAIGFSDREYSELEHARRVAERYSTDHHEFIVSPLQVDVLPVLACHFGEPFADSSVLPTFLLSRLTREHVTVALSGDGGDDVLGGYDRHVAMRLARDRPIGGMVGATMRAAARAIPPSAHPKSNLSRARRFLSAASLSPADRYLQWTRVIDSATQRTLTGRDGGVAARELIRDAMATAGSDDAVEQGLAADAVLYLTNDLLPKADIASMSASLEVRSPFLARAVVEFAVGLPVNLKVLGGQGKRVLRDAVAELVPRENMQRRKMGFAIPIDRWFREELRPLMNDTLLSTRALQRDHVSSNAVRSLVADHESGRIRRGSTLWSLMMLELWAREILDTA